MNIVEGNKNPYLNFTVEESSTNQKDLLVSKNIYTWNRTKGVMHFTFDHACSALKFYIKKATNVEDKQIVVSEVKLCNVKKSGRYYLDKQYGAADCWELLNPTTDYTLFAETDPNKAITLVSDKTQYQLLYAGTLSQDQENAYLFMIPQSLVAWTPLGSNQSTTSGAYIYLKFKLDGVEKEGRIPFAGTFEMGKKHDVYINVGKNSLYDDATGDKIIK